MKLQEFATGGAVATCLEASTVAPDGTYHIQRCIVEILHVQGTRIGIQLSLRERKISSHNLFVTSVWERLDLRCIHSSCYHYPLKVIERCG